MNPNSQRGALVKALRDSSVNLIQDSLTIAMVSKNLLLEAAAALEQQSGPDRSLPSAEAVNYAKQWEGLEISGGLPITHPAFKVLVKEILRLAAQPEAGKDDARDAARWRAARRIFAKEDVERAEAGMEGADSLEEENVKADEAIDEVVQRQCATEGRS